MTHSPSSLERIDAVGVPLPNGTKVTLRVDVRATGRDVPCGAVGQVVGCEQERVVVRLPDGFTFACPRAEVVPTKLGQARYAVRRERAWQALHSGVVVRAMVGSRAWGLADASSDVDVRGVFVLPLPWTTGLVEPPTELVSADGSETFWEVEKAVQQALRADPNTLETLFLPGAEALDEIGAWLLEARHAFVSQELYGSFGRYALSQLKRLGQSLRLAEHREQLVSWVAADPAITLDAAAQRLADATLERGDVAQAKRYIKQLYGSLYDQGMLPARDFESFVRHASSLSASGRDGHALTTLPRKLRPKNAYNLIRLIATATIWLRTGAPEFEATGELRSLLLRIKGGDVPLDAVLKHAQNMMPALDDARAHTRLPKRPDVAAVDRVLRRIREEAARRWFLEPAAPYFGKSGPPAPLVEER